jgi:hypothetical protein
MNTIYEIEDAIRKLSEADLIALRAWFAEFDAAAWIGSSSGTPLRAGWTRWPRRPCGTPARGVAATCESPATPRFWGCYHPLPVEVQWLADACYAVLRQDLRHPSLHLK